MEDIPEESRKVKYIRDIQVPDSLKKYVELENMIFDITKETEKDIVKYISDNFEGDEISFIPYLIISAYKVRPLKIDPLTLLYMSFTVEHGYYLSLETLQNFDFYFANCLVHRGAFSESEKNRTRETKLIVEQELENETFVQALHGYKDENCLEYAIKYDNIEAVREKSQSFIDDNTKLVKICKHDYRHPERMISPLNLAAFYGSVKSFKFFLSNKFQIMLDTYAAAIKGGNLEIIKICDREKQSTKKTNNSAFRWAVHYHHNEAADWLLEQGNPCNVSRKSFFHWFNINALLFMIQNDNGPKGIQNQCEALECLQKHNNMGSFRAMLKYGCDPTIIPERGAHLLTSACCCGLVAAAKLLIEEGVDPNTPKEEEQALNIACANGYESLVRLLLDKGADVNTCDRKEIYPLHEAIESKRERIVKLLFEHKPDLSIKTQQNESILTVICRMKMFGIAKQIVKLGVDINESDWNGMTAFHYVCEYSDRDTVSFFIWNGADINKQTDSGLTPFHFACKGGKLETISLLIANGCTLNPKSVLNRETTPLHFACMSGELTIVKFLVEKGYNINLKSCISDGGLTPLHYACREGYYNVAKYLIMKGADYEIKSDLASNSKTAYEFAKQYVEKAHNEGIIEAENIGKEFEKLFQSLSVS